MFVKLYLIALPVFLVIDMIWLTLVAKNFYAKQIGYLMAKNPNLLAALIFYFMFIAGLIFFVIAPALDIKMWTQALLAGAFFGLVAIWGIRLALNIYNRNNKLYEDKNYYC